MRLLDLLLSAGSALRANKLRSALTTLGVVVGVGAVVAMLSMTTGFQRYVTGEFSRLGANTFQVQKWPGIRIGGRHGSHKWRQRKDLTLPNAAAVRARNDAARGVGAEVWAFGVTVRSRYASEQPRVNVVGGTPEYVNNNGMEVALGRSINASDVQHERAVAVLGQGVARALFPRGSAVGQAMTLANRRYKVIGTLAPTGGFFGMRSQDDFVLVPLSSFLRVFGRKRSVNITVDAWEPEFFGLAIDKTVQILRRERGLKPGDENDFDIVSNVSTMDTLSGLLDSIAWASIGIAFISLLVGGIGIMNIMMVSVTERTREIGVRVAVGARRRDIMWQFAVEAVVLSAAGGLVGLAFGFTVSHLARELFGLPAAAPWWAVVVALGTSSAAGLLFGIYPAWRAARLDPIEALRRE